MTGWDSVPPADRPPVVWLIHLCFDVMVGLGFFLLLAGLWAAWEWWRRRRCRRSGCSGGPGAVSGLAAIVAMECGWVVTEVGRQPWVVYRLQTTAAAATTNGGVIDQPQPGHRLVRGARRRDDRDLADAGPPLAPRRGRGGASRTVRRVEADRAGGPGGAVMAADAVGGILLAGDHACTRCWAGPTSAAGCGTCWPAATGGAARRGR